MLTGERLLTCLRRTDAYFLIASWTNPSTLSVYNGKFVKYVSAVFSFGYTNNSERLGLVVYFYVHN